METAMQVLALIVNKFSFQSLSLALICLLTVTPFFVAYSKEATEHFVYYAWC